MNSLPSQILERQTVKKLSNSHKLNCIGSSNRIAAAVNSPLGKIADTVLKKMMAHLG